MDDRNDSSNVRSPDPLSLQDSRLQGAILWATQQERNSQITQSLEQQLRIASLQKDLLQQRNDHNGLVHSLHSLLHQYEKQLSEQRKEQRGLSGALASLERRLDLGLQSLERRLDLGLQSLERRLDTGLQSLERRLDTGLQSLERRLDTGLQVMPGVTALDQGLTASLRSNEQDAVQTVSEVARGLEGISTQQMVVRLKAEDEQYEHSSRYFIPFAGLPGCKPDHMANDFIRAYFQSPFTWEAKTSTHQVKQRNGEIVDRLAWTAKCLGKSTSGKGCTLRVSKVQCTATPSLVYMKLPSATHRRKEVMFTVAHADDCSFKNVHDASRRIKDVWNGLPDIIQRAIDQLDHERRRFGQSGYGAYAMYLFLMDKEAEWKVPIGKEDLAKYEELLLACGHSAVFIHCGQKQRL
jgi:hypothetical protein